MSIRESAARVKLSGIWYYFSIGVEILGFEARRRTDEVVGN
jgi:hypothetical protein